MNDTIDTGFTIESNPFYTPEMPKEEEKLTFGAVQSALIQNTFLGSAMSHTIDYAVSLAYEEDEEFRKTIGRNVSTLVEEGLSVERALHVVENAKNQEHYYMLLLDQRRKQDQASQLEQAGMSGTLFSIGAEIVDGIASVGGLGRVAVGLTNKFVGFGTKSLESLGLSAKASEYTTRIAGGIGLEVGFEFSKQQIVDNQRTELDYAFAALGGAIGGALSKSKDFQEIADPLSKEMNEALEARADIENIANPLEKEEALSKFNRTKVQQGLEKLQFDYNKKFESSKSATMKALTEGETPIFYNPRFKTVDDFSADEVNNQYNSTVLYAFSEAFADSYNKFRTLNGIFSSTAVKNIREVAGRLDYTQQNNFYKYAGKVIHNLIDETNLPQEVLDLHESIRRGNAKMAEITYNANVKWNHPLFASGKIERNPDYLPIKYNLNKVFSDIGAEVIQESDYVSVISTGLRNTLRNNGVDLDTIPPEDLAQIDAKAKAWVTKQKNRVTSSNKAQATSWLDDADVIDEYEQLVDELIDNYGIAEAQAKTMAKESVTARPTTNQEGITPRTRKRSNIDLSATYTNPETGVTIKLADYVDTNIDMLWKSYGQSMGGDIALRKLGITSRADIKAMRDKIEKELKEAYPNIKDQSAINSELAIFDDTMRQFLGHPLLDDPDGVMNKTVELLQSGARVSFLGGTWFSMLSELSALTAEVGIMKIIKHSDFKSFFKGYTSKSAEASDLLLESRIYNGLGGGAYNHTNRYMYEADNAFTDVQGVARPQTFQGKVSGGLDVMLGATKRAEEFITQVGGSKAGQAIMEQMFVTGMSAKLLRQIQKTGTIDAKLAREFGWSDKVVKKIVDNITTHADIDGKSINVFNFQKWDVDSEIAFNLGMRRYASTLIQSPSIGDTSAIAMGNEVLKNSWYGKLATSLMQYSIMAHSKQLGRTLANMDSKSINRMVWQTAGATAGYYAYTYANFWDDPEEIYNRTMDGNVAFRIMERHPASALIPLTLGVGEEVTGLNLGLGESGTTTPRGLSTPASIKVGQAGIETFNIIGGFLSDDVSITQKRFNNYLNTILPNVLGMRYLNSKIAEEVTAEEEIEAIWR